MRHNYKTIAALKPGKHDDALLEQSLNDAAQGFCSTPLTHAQLLRELRGEPFRLIPRCVIVQSSGKKRIIDNGDTGGQSERSSDWNKLVLCSPLRPAQHIGAVASLLTDDQWHALTSHDARLSGGEDWPIVPTDIPRSVVKKAVGVSYASGTRNAANQPSRCIPPCCLAFHSR